MKSEKPAKIEKTVKTVKRAKKITPTAAKNEAGALSIAARPESPKEKESVSRAEFIRAARRHRGVKFAHQGRNPKFGIDCGGLVLMVARELGLSELEELGYASFPMNGRFDELLRDHADDLGFESRYPHRFDGTEFRSGDLLSFDYENGEGTRHLAIVTRWDADSRCYWILDAQPDYGISEKPLRHPFSRATLHAWSVRGLAD